MTIDEPVQEMGHWVKWVNLIWCVTWVMGQSICDCRLRLLLWMDWVRMRGKGEGEKSTESICLL